jgi:anti-anti-sigma factor
MANQCRAEVRFQNEMAIVKLYGEINRDAEATLNTAYAKAELSNPTTVMLNFKDVDYINSPGIALIVSLLAQTRKSNRRLAVCCLSEHYQEIFRITRISDYVDIFDDEPGALPG